MTTPAGRESPFPAALETEGLKETARIPIEGEPCSVAADGDHVFVIGTEP